MKQMDSEMSTTHHLQKHSSRELQKMLSDIGIRDISHLSKSKLIDIVSQSTVGKQIARKIANSPCKQSKKTNDPNYIKFNKFNKAVFHLVSFYLLYL